ncbi:MAG TPA: GGDEF domain-containing protein [Dongiaceae bacterium]|nr:GGDEF domain-containing protein [Dongiaceae bacterium]
MNAIHLKAVTRSAAILCLAAVAVSLYVLGSYAGGIPEGWRPRIAGFDLGATNSLTAFSILIGASGSFISMRRSWRRLGLAIAAIAGAGAVLRLADAAAGSDLAGLVTPFGAEVMAEQAAGIGNHMGIGAAVSILLCSLASLLIMARRYSAAQLLAALAAGPALTSAAGYLLGVDVWLGRMGAFTLIDILLWTGAILASTGHRAALRAILSDSQPSHFARHQLVIATAAPLGFAVLFSRLLPTAEHPDAVAETVVGTILVAWITIGVTAIVSRRLDIARYRAEAELRAMTRIDPLTGLLNRRSMDLALNDHFERARETGRPISLLMCDLDRFKKLNDEYGHAAGDRVLKRTADRISAAVRESDLVFRYGGEEIAALLEDCGPETAWRIAEQIRESVKAPGRRAADAELPLVTISIGAATTGAGKTLPGRVLAAADECLYQAKEGGRDRVVQTTLP